jgi:mannose-1-phosphate guanylyltransferase / mannose-6-phosphate isomerase
MLVPVILSGGPGTRLWPVSREGLPKPFMKVAGEHSLLQETLLRSEGLPAAERSVVVTNRDYLFLSRDEVDGLGGTVRPARYLLEPVGRNTAPAILMSAIAVAQWHGDDTVLLVMPADHVIENAAAFATAVAHAAALARGGRLVTFGIRPTRPETGYGYIELGDALGADGHRVKRFVEKPDAARAQEFVQSPAFLWNSGIFCFRARDMIAAFDALEPDMAKAGRACWSASSPATSSADAIELDKASFTGMRSVSIDYAIFERAPEVAVVPCSIGWSDVGSWKEIADRYAPDAAGNRCDGDVMFLDSRDSFVLVDGRMAAAIGINNLIVIDTPDALLVADRERTQDVKKIVERLKAAGSDKYALHLTVARPWGTYTVLQDSARFKIKRVEVKPGASLSLQMHHYRNEHWVVVSGTALVVNGERTLMLQTNESTYIPAGHKHRLENPGKENLVIIEVQVGDYLGEDDIVRFEDRYGRVAETTAKSAAA